MLKEIKQKYLRNRRRVLQDGVMPWPEGSLIRTGMEIRIKIRIERYAGRYKTSSNPPVSCCDEQKRRDQGACDAGGTLLDDEGYDSI